MAPHDKNAHQLQVTFFSSDFERWKLKFFKLWGRSFWVLLALLIGYMLGEGVTEKRVLDDCRYSNSFRVGYLAYSCARRNI